MYVCDQCPYTTKFQNCFKIHHEKVARVVSNKSLCAQKNHKSASHMKRLFRHLLCNDRTYNSSIYHGYFLTSTWIIKTVNRLQAEGGGRGLREGG